MSKVEAVECVNLLKVYGTTALLATKLLILACHAVV